MTRYTSLPALRLVLLFIFLGGTAAAQNGYWQQQADYTMEIDFDVEKNRFSGSQKLVYRNNSPDTLHKVFYHLFFNAFQPGSMMDVRSRTIADPDSRVGDRIAGLGPSEIGFLRAKVMKQDGRSLKFLEDGTILVVDLAHPVLPGAETVLEMEFTGQVPVQIRRSGRDNREGIRYSMSQWYPKICEYDRMGWHANPYVGREFHGVWGSFDVKIDIDKDYVLAGTGYLQNPQEIGYGYEEEGQKVKRKGKDKLQWHFAAPQVHDFVWVADPDLTHRRFRTEDGPELHFFFQDDSLTEAWAQLPEYTAKAFAIMSERFGKYPYKQYSVIQGGDGGMEYPMATLVTGNRSLRSLVGVTVHELIHSWYQCVLATNESLYSWMDEGFTSYATSEVMAELFGGDTRRTHARSYDSYFTIIEMGLQEPMNTHSDHYQANATYSVNSYAKGSVTLHQLSYVIGQDALDRGMRRFFHEWKFRHPDPVDFRRCMEKASGLELGWYFNYWLNSTHTIDYGFGSVYAIGEETRVELKRIGAMPMPVEVMVTYRDGKQELFYMPLRIMRGEKPAEDAGMARYVKDDWPWTNPSYVLDLNRPLSEIERLEIDPSGRMADVDRGNNVLLPATLLDVE